MATATNQAIQIKSLSTTLTVDDIQASIRFFEALGFSISDKWEHDGKMAGAMLKAGDTEVGVMQDDWKKGRDRQKGIGTRMLIRVQGVDDLAAKAKAAGITLDSEPRDTEWGRVFEVTEPTGFKITVYQAKQ